MNKSYYQEMEDIINSYNLSHNFIVSYALACAKDVNPKPNKETLKCFELLDKWLINADSVSNRELLEAADAAYANVSHYATHAAANAYYATTNAAYVANVAAHVSAKDVKTYKDKYKNLLLTMISTKYGELGISLMNYNKGDKK